MQQFFDNRLRLYSTLFLCVPLFSRRLCEQQHLRRVAAAHRVPSVQPGAGLRPAGAWGRPLPQELGGQTAPGAGGRQQPGGEAAETRRR